MLHWPHWFKVIFEQAAAAVLEQNAGNPFKVAVLLDRDVFPELELNSTLSTKPMLRGGVLEIKNVLRVVVVAANVSACWAVDWIGGGVMKKGGGARLSGVLFVPTLEELGKKDIFI